VGHLWGHRLPGADHENSFAPCELFPERGRCLEKGNQQKIPEQLESYREQFVQGSAANGVKADIAARIYDVILRFGQYGSTSLTVPHMPGCVPDSIPEGAPLPAFHGAILTNEVNDTDSLIKYIAECREGNVSILLRT